MIYFCSFQRLNKLAIIKNNIIRTHNSLVESDRAAKEMEQAIMKQMEPIDKEVNERKQQKNFDWRSMNSEKREK